MTIDDYKLFRKNNVSQKYSILYSIGLFQWQNFANIHIYLEISKSQILVKKKQNLVKPNGTKKPWYLVSALFDCYC